LTENSSNAIAVAAAPLQPGAGSLRRELGLRDLVLAQLLYIVVPEFFGTAAKAGPSHVVLWMLAVALFFVPLAFVVAQLNRRMPLEGGLYEWARLAFGDAIGFLVAWNLWLYAVIYMALAGLITTSFVAYAVGPNAASMVTSKWLVLVVSCVLILTMVLLARAGFAIAKWVTNAGAVFTLIVLASLVMTPLLQTHGPAARFNPLRLVIPPLSVFTLSVFSKMTFGALCGFEYIAIFAAECRSPERNLPRSVILTAPVIVLVYVLGTSAVLYFSTPEAVDVVATIPQALSRNFHSFGLAKTIVPLSILMLLVNYLATFNINFNGCSRLPMVAGWDHLLPEWLTRLHPKHKTPVNSIAFAGAIAMVASIAALIGVAEQEAFELLLVWAFAFYATAYLALFAIPLLAGKKLGINVPGWLLIGALSGLAMTVLYIVLSVFPIIDVQSNWKYSVKTAAVILGANLVGIVIYRWRGTREPLAEP
jgi:glutamate:GABA antiporter